MCDEGRARASARCLGTSRHQRDCGQSGALAAMRVRGSFHHLLAGTRRYNCDQSSPMNVVLSILSRSFYYNYLHDRWELVVPTSLVHGSVVHSSLQRQYPRDRVTLPESRHEEMCRLEMYPFVIDSSFVCTLLFFRNNRFPSSFRSSRAGKDTTTYSSPLVHCKYFSPARLFLVEKSKKECRTCRNVTFF